MKQIIDKFLLKIMSKVVLFLEFIFILCGLFFGFNSVLILLFFVIFLYYIKIGNREMDKEDVVDGIDDNDFQSEK